jgi:hypothetical protein
MYISYRPLLLLQGKRFFLLRESPEISRADYDGRARGFFIS